MISAIAQVLALVLVSTFALDARAQSLPPPAPAASQQLLKAEELDQLMAPIALYPDALLSNVLMASTYPLEVIEADRWAKANKNLKGEQLKAEITKQRWDDSVKQLAATPSVLDMMSAKLDWTQKLGDAVLAQQADVMDSVQRLRSRADAQNTLKTTKEQKVTKQTQQGKQVIVIEPTQPETVYVPYYNPTTAYGAWPYPAYPPFYYPQPLWYPGTLAAGAIGFGLGVAVGAAWGGGFGWGNNNINVNRNVDINNIKNFQHNPEHRGGVRYNNSQVSQKFGKGDRAAGAQQRMDFRGRDGQQVVKPGGDRPGGDRAGAGDRKGGDRANVADRKGGDRPGAGDRKGGDRPSAGDRKGGGDRAGQRPAGGQRPGGGRDGGLGNPGHGRNAMAHSDRGRASLGGGPGGGGARMGGHAGGGPRGGGGARGGGGGRRSDVALKHDVVLLGTLGSGIGFYRFAYHGSDKAYVGVMAQEVRAVMPDAVVQGRDGYLRVRYEKLGLKFETYEQWLAAGARFPAAAAGMR